MCAIDHIICDFRFDYINATEFEVYDYDVHHTGPYGSCNELNTCTLNGCDTTCAKCKLSFSSTNATIEEVMHV